ncbi:MAG TPA: NADPH-dependent oxidoreductase [Clostridiaceae bacterium]|nr:NADPH-dependent oxidoreductase [Clostridiaceae bacterium]
MNETIRQQLKHRTCRKYTDRPVSAEVIDTLIEVALRTASHMHMQAWSIIRVTDRAQKERLFEITKQPYMLEVPELWIFLVDCRRNYRIVEAQGYTGLAAQNLDRFMQGYIDACLAAQNVMTAVESLGMGGVYFGSIARDYAATCSILELPDLTFPVVGVGFGYPAEEWVIKPRLPAIFRVFENTYQDKISDLSDLNSYNKAMSEYCDQRRPNQPEGPFTEMLLNVMSHVFSDQSTLLQAIKAQGFVVD